VLDDTEARVIVPAGNTGTAVNVETPVTPKVPPTVALPVIVWVSVVAPPVLVSPLELFNLVEVRLVAVSLFVVGAEFRTTEPVPEEVPVPVPPLVTGNKPDTPLARDTCPHVEVPTPLPTRTLLAVGVDAPVPTLVSTATIAVCSWLD
jgi:hypothetical protein